ncbi:MAG: hypothetical protein QM627_06075 [Luteolibacter sp.]
MKRLTLISLIVCGVAGSLARASDEAQRVSVAPNNDLSSLTVALPKGSGFGSSACGSDLTKEYQEGYRIGVRNNHHGRRNILVVDDGKTKFPHTDQATGLPLVILTDAKATRAFLDLVQGYNKAMRQANEQREKMRK